MRKLSMNELNRVSSEEFKNILKLPVIIVLENIRSLSNVGSFFRTADAFKIEGLYLCGITAQPPHREINKTALGATETVEWKYFDSSVQAIDALEKKGYKTFCVEQTTQSSILWDFEPSENMAFIFGNEVDGVSVEALSRCAAAVEIPQAGTKHSLNVSVCGGIVMWHVFSKLMNANQ